MSPDPRRALEEKLRGRLELSCSEAFTLAQEVSCQPALVREVADRLSVRITRCQLGLFGPKGWTRAQPSGIDRGDAVTAAVRGQVALHLQERGAAPLTCAEAWALAAQLGVPRHVIGELADELGIRIRGCQLGCF
jgi:hypothetical protein